MPRWARGGRATPGGAANGRVSPLPALLSAVLLLAGAAYLAAHLDPLPPPISGSARVVDGDTLRLDGDRVRLLGIDAPELDQQCTTANGKPWACGEAARKALSQELNKGRIRCDPDGRDQYGRVLATCSVNGADLGAAMVTAGLAVSYPDYGAEQEAARQARRGMWQGPFVTPREWRRSGGNATADNDPPRDWPAALWSWVRQLTGARTLR